jgi:hypothetical protein
MAALILFFYLVVTTAMVAGIYLALTGGGNAMRAVGLGIFLIYWFVGLALTDLVLAL